MTSGAVSAPNPGEKMLRFFEYRHLPEHLQAVSKPIGELAEQMVATLPPGPETTAGLRKLLEAKDCFVRAKQRAAGREPSTDQGDGQREATAERTSCPSSPPAATTLEPWDCGDSSCLLRGTTHAHPLTTLPPVANEEHIAAEVWRTVRRLEKRAESAEATLQEIADALGTGEDGEDLVRVARDAHTAEVQITHVELAAESWKDRALEAEAELARLKQPKCSACNDTGKVAVFDCTQASCTGEHDCHECPTSARDYELMLTDRDAEIEKLRAELDRLTTLRPVGEWTEEDGRVFIYFAVTRPPVMISAEPATFPECIGWTPLPKVIRGVRRDPYRTPRASRAVSVRRR